MIEIAAMSSILPRHSGGMSASLRATELQLAPPVVASPAGIDRRTRARVLRRRRPVVPRSDSQR